MKLIAIAVTLLITACGSPETSNLQENPTDSPDVVFADQLNPNQLARFKNHANKYVRKAVNLKLTADAANRKDITLLAKGLLKEDVKFATIAQKINSDKAATETLLAALYETIDEKTTKHGSISLRSNMGKLLSSGKDADSQPISGLYEATLQLIKQHPQLTSGLVNFRPTHNEIVQTKLALIYGQLAASNSNNLADLPAFDQLQLMYPDEIVDRMSTEALASYGLFNPQTNKIYMPNAGFVYGGTMQNDVCRGIDCSAFVSEATASPRLTTMVMQYSWRHLMDLPFDEQQSAIRTEFLNQYDMDKAIDLFSAVESKKENLTAGDLLIWTTDKGYQGHVVMFLEQLSDGHLLTIEANREDDKSMEGIIFRKLDFDRDGKNTYILRRK